MDIIIQWCINNLLACISLLIGIIGIILAIYFGIKRKRPVWLKRSIKVIDEGAKNIPNLSILYNDKSINNITITKLVFWNRGGKTVRKEDLVEKDPLMIKIDKRYDILKADILETTSEANNIQIDYNSKEIYFSFDFLQKAHGFVLQIIHTGKASSNFSCHGTIIDVGSLAEMNKVNNIPAPLRYVSNIDIVLGKKIIQIVFGLCISIFYIGGGILLLFYNSSRQQDILISPVIDEIVRIIFSILFILFGFFSIFIYRKASGFEIPKKLRKSYKESQFD